MVATTRSQREKRDHTILVAIVGGFFAVIAAAVGAFISIHGTSATVSSSSPSTEAPVISGSAAPTSSSVSPVFVTKCVFSDRNPRCTSSNSGVVIDSDGGPYDSTYSPGCTIVVEINWGDGSVVQSVTMAGNPTGIRYTAGHVFSNTGTYTITVTGIVTSGNCTITPNNYTFTYT